MAKIKIEDLPVLEELSAAKIKGIFGGMSSDTYDPRALAIPPSIEDTSRFELDAIADEEVRDMEKSDTSSPSQPGCE